MFWEYYVVFALGLVSSLHCVSMCGPLVVAYSLPLGGRRFGEQTLAHLAYNGGRILTYAALGALAGLFGGTVGFVGSLAGLENLAAIAAGALMLVAGALMLDLVPGGRLQKLNPLRYTSRLLRPLGGRIAAPSVASKFTLGLLLGFMPCGLIYAALLKSMATGTWLAGAMTMTAFGLGTACSLLGIGVFSSAVGLRIGRWGNRLAAASVLLLGLFIVARGVAAAARPAPSPAADVPACHHM